METIYKTKVSFARGEMNWPVLYDNNGKWLVFADMYGSSDKQDDVYIVENENSREAAERKALARVQQVLLEWYST